MFKKIIFYLTNFLELQLVITIISLPILIHWGLPLSKMSFIANLIFTPLLTVYLSCSSIIAFSVLFPIPHTPFVWIINNITDLWLYLLSFGNPTWLIGFSYPMILPSICTALCVIYVYTTYKPNLTRNIFLLSFLFLLLLSIRTSLPLKQSQKILNLPLYICHIKNKTYLIDKGGLCCKKNFYNFIDYTLIPEIIKKTGLTTIDTLVCYKPHKNLIPIINQLIEQTNISTILVSTKEGCFYKVKEHFANKDITIFPIKKACSL